MSVSRCSILNASNVSSIARRSLHRHSTDVAHHQGEPVSVMSCTVAPTYTYCGRTREVSAAAHGSDPASSARSVGSGCYEIEVEEIGARMLGDQRGCLGWDQVEASLRSRQRAEDVQPSLQPGALLEDGRQLRRSQVRHCSESLRRVPMSAPTRGRAWPAHRRWASDAPQGTTTVRSVSTSL